METMFWFAVAFIAYTYVGYPALLGVWAAIKRVRRVRLNADDANQDLPHVSVIIAARDEAPRLPARIENILASDYPLDKLQIIVASDGSTDRTPEVLAPYGRRVRVLTLPPSGKAGAINAAMQEADGPIVVFADARQRFAADAIRRLVSHFDDPETGAVSGELVIQTGDSSIGDGVGAYWKYEKWIRRHEALVGSTIGVTGAIYAMRHALYRPLPPDTILDDVMTPMRLVLRGYRVGFDERAIAYDEAAKDASAEMRRKTRTLAGNFQLLAREPRLLIPLLNPAWLQFVSHKVARLFVPYALLAALVSSASLAAAAPIYAAAFAAQVIFYGLACSGAALDREARAVTRPIEVYREAA